MKWTFSNTPIDQAPKGYVRIRLTEDDRGIRRVVREGDIELIEIGTGKRSEMTRRKFLVTCRAVIRTAKIAKAKKIAIQFDQSPFPALTDVPLPELAALTAENFEMADFEFTAFKTKPKEGWSTVDEVLVCGNTPKAMKDGYARGRAIGQAVNAARILSNTPGGDMTPTSLAKAAKQAAAGTSITVQIYTRAQLQKLGMGALLGVAKGSTEPPTFTVMEYKGAPGKPIVLAGKGITFDSGGLNLKPTSGIYEMHMDMAGAASVISTVALAAKLKLKKHVIGLIPAAENMPSGNALRPGDILRSLSGKSIEVLNTDAEGRLVLADALTYAKRLHPAVVLDVATLTGASMVALGLHANAVMTRDDALADTLIALGESSGDYAWRLPLWEEYEDMMKSSFADIANDATSGGRFGGATQGGIFLHAFAKELDCPWAHIDIAPRMVAIPGEELSKGASGTPVRMLIAFIEQWKP